MTPIPSVHPPSAPSVSPGGDSGSEPIVSCRGLWKIYGPGAEALLRRRNEGPSPEELKESQCIAAVRDVSLQVFPGEILVVMGLSGSGKSTLARCLSRLIEPTGGEVFFEGRDLLRASPAELIELRRHRMGMVFQHFALLPHRTVLQNVAFPLEVQGVPPRERERQAAEMLELVGLRGREGYYPRELSGGQQQRVGIARSLAVKPDLWFLDEPFSALDPLIRREMQDEFLRLQALLRKTIIFITHDFDEALRLADRIAIMFEGGVDQIDAPEALVLNPRTDYVREFTKDVSRDKVLTVGGVAEPVPDAPGGADAEIAGGEISKSAKLGDAARQILSADKPLRVVDDDGAPAGIVRRERVIETLFGSADSGRSDSARSDSSRS